MKRHWSLVAVGISAMLFASSAQAASVNPKSDVHRDRGNMFWSGGGARAVNGMMWFVDNDDHKPKKKKKQSEELVQKEEEKPSTDLDVVIDENTGSEQLNNNGNNTPPPFDGEDTTPPGNLFEDSNDPGPDQNMEIEVEVPQAVVPLPPAAWAGLATMVGAGWTMRKRFIGA